MHSGCFVRLPAGGRPLRSLCGPSARCREGPVLAGPGPRRSRLGRGDRVLWRCGATAEGRNTVPSTVDAPSAGDTAPRDNAAVELGSGQVETGPLRNPLDQASKQGVRCITFEMQVLRLGTTVCITCACPSGRGSSCQPTRRADMGIHTAFNLPLLLLGHIHGVYEGEEHILGCLNRTPTLPASAPGTRCLAGACTKRRLSQQLLLSLCPGLDATHCTSLGKRCEASSSRRPGGCLGGCAAAAPA